jgi:hypothetical protein
MTSANTNCLQRMPLAPGFPDPPRGDYPGSLGPMESFPQRTRLLPLRQEAPASGFPHLARPGPVQSPDAAPLWGRRRFLSPSGDPDYIGLQAQDGPYEALDTTGVPTRDAKRRGGAGWLVGQADIGWSNRLGWYEGFHRLLSVNPQGVITGFSFAPASTSDPALAEGFFGFRRFPHPRIATVGGPAQGYYIVDQGFEGKERHRHWHRHYGARVVCPPKGNPDFSRGQPWPKRWRSWVAGLGRL